jgi:hypothetical protein
MGGITEDFEECWTGKLVQFLNIGCPDQIYSCRDPVRDDCRRNGRGISICRHFLEGSLEIASTNLHSIRSQNGRLHLAADLGAPRSSRSKRG